MFLKIILICSTIYLVQSKSNCSNYLRHLSIEQSGFVQCVTENSVPVTVCVTCQNHYQNVLHWYDILSTNCSDIYFDKDRINLIASTEIFLTGLWSKAYCDDCFNNKNIFVFNEKNEKLYDCFNEHVTEPCDNCKLQYSELNNFYINLDQHNNGEVCYDIQDSMNRTRKKWSKEWKCCSRERNLTLFIVVLALTSCLPVLFYGITFCITKRQERHQRILFNEAPYNSEEPSSSHRNIINDINNPTRYLHENLPSSSNAETTNTAASTTLRPKDINELNSNRDIEESSDDELLLNSTIPSKEKIKNI